MSFVRRVIRGFGALTRPAIAEQEAADEVAHFLQEAAAEHRARGLSDQDALRAARLELGSPTGVREQVRRFGLSLVRAPPPYIYVWRLFGRPARQ